VVVQGRGCIDLESMDTESLREVLVAARNILAKRRFHAAKVKVGDEIFPGGRMARVVKIKKDTVVFERTGSGGFGTYETKEVPYSSVVKGW